MDQVVLKKVRALTEGFPTLGAFIGLYSRMDPLVPSKEAFFVKNPPTFITLENVFLFLDHRAFP